MKLKSLAVAIIASSAIFSAGPAAATIIDISAANPSGTSQTFNTGGSYLFSWIGTASGGAYDAWSTAATGGSWLNSILVSTNSAAAVPHGTGLSYTTPGAALAAVQSASFGLTLNSGDILTFTLDNTSFTPVGGPEGGGVSLNVTAQVPEPATYALLLTGLGLLGFTATRRKCFVV